jgi:predicted ATP-grasp superfamily ATP-dependent carboligase
MNCIVTDARYRMSVSIIRSLGKAGIRVTALEDRLPLMEILGFHSKYVSGTEYVTSAHVSHDRFVEDLLRLSPGHDAVIPVTTNSILAIAKNRDKLADKLRFIVPDEETINLADDKGRLMQKAAELGIPAPFTTTLNEGEEAGVLAERLKYPVVVKYRAGEKLGLHAKERYAIVRDKEEFSRVFTSMHAKQPYPLVQEYLPGGGFGVSAFFNRDGEPVVLFGHKRLREYPVAGGPSCLCESVYMPELNAYAVKLLQGLGWQGVAMVEFKQAADGSFRLMEINPRIWGSFPLTLAAGVDFPLIMYKTIMGEKVKPLLETPPGRKMRFLVQDLMSARGYLRQSGDKTAFVRGFLRDLTDPGIKDGLFSWDDPKPGWYYLQNIFHKAVKR